MMLYCTNATVYELAKYQLHAYNIFHVNGHNSIDLSLSLSDYLFSKMYCSFYVFIVSIASSVSINRRTSYWMKINS